MSNHDLNLKVRFFEIGMPKSKPNLKYLRHNLVHFNVFGVGVFWNRLSRQADSTTVIGFQYISMYVVCEMKFPVQYSRPFSLLWSHIEVPACDFLILMSLKTWTQSLTVFMQGKVFIIYEHQVLHCYNIMNIWWNC